MALVLKGMQAGVAAVIMDVVCSLGSKVIKERSFLHIAVMIAAFAATFFFEINVIYIILAAAAVGVINALIKLRKEKKNDFSAPFPFFLTGGTFQHRRRICCNAPDTKPGCGYLPLAYYGRIY